MHLWLCSQTQAIFNYKSLMVLQITLHTLHPLFMLNALFLGLRGSQSFVEVGYESQVYFRFHNGYYIIRYYTK